MRDIVNLLTTSKRPVNNNFHAIIKITLVEAKDQLVEEVEEDNEVKMNLKHVEDEIQEKELRRKELEKNIQQKRNYLEIDCEREAEVAFQAYVEQHANVFEAIQNEGGPEVNIE